MSRAGRPLILSDIKASLNVITGIKGGAPADATTYYPGSGMPSVSRLGRLTIGAGALTATILAGPGLTAPAQATPAHAAGQRPAPGARPPGPPAGPADAAALAHVPRCT